MIFNVVSFRRWRGVFLVFVSATLAHAADSVTPIGQVLFGAGDVQVNGSAAQANRSISAGTALDVGSAPVTINLGSDHVLNLAPGTRIRVVSQNEVVLEKGEIRGAQEMHPGSVTTPFKVGTPEGTLNLEGGRYVAKIGSSQEVTVGNLDGPASFHSLGSKNLRTLVSTDSLVTINRKEKDSEDSTMVAHAGSASEYYHSMPSASGVQTPPITTILPDQARSSVSAWQGLDLPIGAGPSGILGLNAVTGSTPTGIDPLQRPTTSQITATLHY